MKKQTEYYIRSGWNVYPQSRPVEGRALNISLSDLDGSIVYIGKGKGFYKNYCGVCIEVNNTLIDSNKSLLWAYTD